MSMYLNDTLALLNSHVSVRKFNGKTITEDHEAAIVQAALRGATAGNMMLYSMITIRSKDVLRQLAESCDNQPFIGEADLAILFVVDNHKWDAYFKARNIASLFPDFRGPEIPDFMLGMQDAMIAAQNAVIAAESLGIGTCYIGDIMEQYEHHKALFHLPAHTMPATLVVFGHYDQKPQLRPRFSEQHVVFSERYPDLNAEFIEAMFEENEKSTEQFAQKFYARKIHAPFFKEMIRSIKLYLNEWL